MAEPERTTRGIFAYIQEHADDLSFELTCQEEIRELTNSPRCAWEQFLVDLFDDEEPVDG
jgi:hypothetical protein